MKTLPFGLSPEWIAIGLAACLTGIAASAPAAEQRPNIVFILADDLGWADIGYHDSEIDTPHLDELAAGGVRLEQHYVYPTCSPSRVALLSGCNPSRFGVTNPLADQSPVPQGAMHLVGGLNELGYATHIVGKWHIGAEPGVRPLDYGFDTSYGYLRGQIDPYTHYYKTGAPTWHRNDQIIEQAGRNDPGHVTDLITDEAVRIIETSGKQDGGETAQRPFFLYVTYSVPHYPLAESPEWVDRYDGRIQDVWRKLYAASVTHMDAGIGRIVDTLDRLGRRDETLIIFTSDNGGQKDWNARENLYNGRYPPHTTLGNNKPLRGWKTTLYEGGIRVPALANWTGILAAGTVVETPVHIYDWAPTLINLAGGEADPAWKLDGRNIWSLLTEGPQKGPQRTFYWDLRRSGALRHGDWKLIVHRDGENELFNIAEDPAEQMDLAEKHPERVAEMAAMLRREQAREE